MYKYNKSGNYYRKNKPKLFNKNYTKNSLAENTNNNNSLLAYKQLL